MEGLKKLLSGLFKIDLSRLKKLGINIFSNNQIDISKKIENNVFNLNISGLTPEDAKKVQGEIIKAFVKQETPVLLKESKDLLEDIEAANKEQSNQETLEYFEDKIPLADVPILRAALYIRHVYRRGGSVEKLKQDIAFRYGQRGRIIANLCTAGYFEDVFQPMYEQMVRAGGFSLDEFRDRYNVLVTQSPQAIFVNRWDSVESLKGEILKKIEINKKYKVGYLALHGRGRNNVNKILELLRDADIQKQIVGDPEIDSKADFIAAKIRF